MYNEMDIRNKKFFDAISRKFLIGLGILLGIVISFVGGKILLSTDEHQKLPQQTPLKQE